MAQGWTARVSIWVALVSASLASLGVLWGLSWNGAEDAVITALSDHLTAEAALAGEHLRELPVDVLVGLGRGHASEAVAAELSRLTGSSGLHDAALIGPDDVVLGSGGSWLPAEADVDLITRARAGTLAAGSLYRASDGELYLSAYAPLPDQQGWVVAIEGSATLGAVDQLARRQALASVVVVLVVGALGGLLAGWIAQPMRTLAADLIRVRPGDPPEAVVVGGPQEIVQVASAAQRLLEAIRERDEAVARGHREQLDQLTRFAAGVAHEIRNPLNAVGLSVARLARLDDPERRAVVAERVRGQLDELDAIVGRLVDLTRPIQPRLGEARLGDLLARIEEECEVELEVQAPRDAVLVTDANLVVEILRNLVLNAQQAGATRIHIAVEGPPWALSVTDDGHGIDDPEDLFAWFHTTRAQGSGIGLPMSRRIAETLGGALDLAANHPATFRLLLPGDPP